MFCIKNLSTVETFQEDPWSGKYLKVPAKEKWADPKVAYLFFSGYEGLTPGQRVSQLNPPVYLHAFVADYDANLPLDQVNKSLEKAEFKPTWISRTINNGVRLIWLLDNKVLISHEPLGKELIKVAAKRLNLKRLLPHWDQEAWDSTAKYYARGLDWTKTGDPLSEQMVMLWSLEAGNRLKWTASALESIPLTVVSEEVEKRWPGKWTSAWEIGAQGPRFWDPMADNSRAAVLRATGVQCFTGTKAFVSWTEILGPGFVEQFKADRIVGALTDVWYDGKTFWKKDSSGYWQSWDKSNLMLALKVQGLNPLPERGSTCSELDRALVHAIENLRVSASGNYVFFPEGILNLKGKRVLNRSQLRPLSPAPKAGAWGKSFPWLAKFLDNFLYDKKQLEHFLAWLQHAYKGAVDLKPRKGQNIFIVGGVNSGKTLFSDGVLSALFGGHYDASEYVASGGNFSNGAFDYFLWTVGDAKPLSDNLSRRRFTAQLKALAANRDHQVNEKYEKGYMTEWFGRVLITANNDPESIAILPDVDMSNRDKTNFYLCQEKPNEFPVDLSHILAQELPHFAAWLLAMTPAKWLTPCPRFGWTSFQDPRLLGQAQQSSDSGRLEELLYTYADDLLSDKGVWTGSPTQLMDALSRASDGLGSARDWNGISLGRALAHMASSRPYVQKKRNSRARLYMVNLKELKASFDGEHAE